jgi:hypothetical protein
LHRQLQAVVPSLTFLFYFTVLVADLHSAVYAANVTTPNTRAGLALQQQLARQEQRNQQHAEGEHG